MLLRPACRALGASSPLRAALGLRRPLATIATTAWPVPAHATTSPLALATSQRLLARGLHSTGFARAASAPAASDPSITATNRSASAAPPFVESLLLSKETQITTLPNGLRIASQDAPGHFVAVGVYVDAGTRYESDEMTGCSHVLDRTSFKSTQKYTTEELVQQLESLGGNVVAHSSREAIMYQGAVFRHDLDKMVEIFGEVIRRPRLNPEEMDDTRQTTLYEIQDLSVRPDMMLPEYVHATAFRREDNSPDTLGRPLLCPVSNLETMTPALLHRYREIWYTPERIVVAGIGMDHQMLVDLAKREFGDMPPATSEIKAAQAALTKPARYVGGIDIIDTKDQPPSANPDDRPLTHIYIAFEALSMSDPDIYALATLTSLMGGGGSFSAGGPGKGMYTRLYTQVLNRYHWVESCNMVNFSYLDAGLFGIQAAVPPSPEAHAQIIPILCDQLLRMTTEIGPQELSRAKNQLKSSLLMSLESKVVELEDVGRQVMVHGKRLGVQEMCARIEALTAEDLKRVARRVILGHDVASPLDYGDAAQKPWVRTGDGRATVVVQGPIFEGDAMLEMEKHLKDWRMGKNNNADNPAAAASPTASGGRKWGMGRFKL
ncbi:Mitochondrial-processing peptidase subunit alpha [Geranomyces variabilis]|nr:Mitochondrial-processing peptidase subunit alpha [Geranomyces variabilis]